MYLPPGPSECLKIWRRKSNTMSSIGTVFYSIPGKNWWDQSPRPYLFRRLCIYLSLYCQATLPLKGSDFGFKGCLCVSIAPALEFGLVYPPNNFPVSTISGDVGGGMCGRRRQQAWWHVRRGGGGSTTAATAATPATPMAARAATWPRTAAWRPANGRFKNGP